MFTTNCKKQLSESRDVYCDTLGPPLVGGTDSGLKSTLNDRDARFSFLWIHLGLLLYEMFWFFLSFRRTSNFPSIKEASTKLYSWTSFLIFERIVRVFRPSFLLLSLGISLLYGSTSFFHFLPPNLFLPILFDVVEKDFFIINFMESGCKVGYELLPFNYRKGNVFIYLLISPSDINEFSKFTTSLSYRQGSTSFHH